MFDDRLTNAAMQTPNLVERFRRAGFSKKSFQRGAAAISRLFVAFVKNAERFQFRFGPFGNRRRQRQYLFRTLRQIRRINDPLKTIDGTRGAARAVEPGNDRGNPGIAGHLLSHAAPQEKLADVRASMRSHDDQIATACFRIAHNHLRRIVVALRNNGLNYPDRRRLRYESNVRSPRTARQRPRPAGTRCWRLPKSPLETESIES